MRKDTFATISFEADKFSLIALVFQVGGSKVLKINAL